LKLTELFQDAPNKKLLLSGNDAFARGIFEAGVRFAANYPGTPLSEVGDNLKYLSETRDDFTFDYSLNEKVALESCIGASWSGVRSIAMFKHLGLNVAADPLHSFPYSGVKGGMIILCGGDPGILSSTNAQDNRLYSLHSKIPIIEPGTVQECKDFIRDGLRLSELYELPVYVHVTTRICHSHGIVTLGDVKEPKIEGYFEKDADRYINTLKRALKNQEKLHEKITRIAKNKKLFYQFNRIRAENQAKNTTGIITSGISYSYVIQACQKLGIKSPILKLGFLFPINREEICEFANQNHLSKLLVVEESESFIETFIKSVFCNYCEVKRDLEIHGKDSLPSIGELNTDIILKFLVDHFEHENPLIMGQLSRKEKILEEIIPGLPVREPTFCPGCQYRPVFYALKEITKSFMKKEDLVFIFAGDIGCYTLSEAYPYQLLDWVTCMGAGLGIANGMAHVIGKKQKLIAYIGDSTFLHSGIPALLNAIKNNIDLTLILFNNYWTSMTGQQEHPGTPRKYITRFGSKSKTDVKELDIIKFLQNIGLERDNLEVTGAYNISHLKRLFQSILEKDGTRVIVINEECALKKKRRLREEKAALDQVQNNYTYYTITDTCTKCNVCIEKFGCPAINVSIMENSESDYFIDEAMCIPEICPGVCKSLCKNNSILKTIINPHLEES